MNKRIRWIDIAKGILILLVIIGHCEVGSCVKYVIYSFHMGAFFFLSGLTFSTKNDPKVFVAKKVLNTEIIAKHNKDNTNLFLLFILYLPLITII